MAAASSSTPITSNHCVLCKRPPPVFERDQLPCGHKAHQACMRMLATAGPLICPLKDCNGEVQKDVRPVPQGRMNTPRRQRRVRYADADWTRVYDIALATLLVRSGLPYGGVIAIPILFGGVIARVADHRYGTQMNQYLPWRIQYMHRWVARPLIRIAPFFLRCIWYGMVRPTVSLVTRISWFMRGLNGACRGVLRIGFYVLKIFARQVIRLLQVFEALDRREYKQAFVGILKFYTLFWPLDTSKEWFDRPRPHLSFIHAFLLEESQALFREPTPENAAQTAAARNMLMGAVRQMPEILAASSSNLPEKSK